MPPLPPPGPGGGGGGGVNPPPPGGGDNCPPTNTPWYADNPRPLCGDGIPNEYDYAPPPFIWSYTGDDGTTFYDLYPNTEPSFIFDPNDNYETLYPRFSELVKNLKAFVKGSPEVMAALQKWSGFSKQKILEKLTFGNGPKIKVEEMHGSVGWNNEKTSPGIIHVRASFVRGLESSYYQSTKQSTAFLLAVTILHEFVHYGRHHNKLSEGGYEWGWGFEQEAFNVIISDENASKYYLNISKYF
jgi:Metallopeptidase toxin 3